MTQTMSDKLELIAKCIREGREVQVQNSYNDWVISQMVHNDNGFIQVFDDIEYRAKPERPRMGLLKVPCGETEEWKEICVKAYEATPEVEKALEDAGLI